MYKPRLKNRNIRRKKKKGTNEWIALLVVFFLIVMGVEFYEFIDRGSPLRSLGIKCNNINPEEIQGKVGLTPGTNLFGAGLKEIVCNLTKDSRIKNVHVLKNLFEGRVEIEVNERTPFAKILKSSTDKCLEVDADGVIIGEADNVSSNLPLITGLQVDDSSRSPKVKDTKILEKAIGILKMGISFNVPIEEISEVNLTNPDDVVFFTNHGTEFHLGNEDLRNRLKRAGIIIAEAANKGVPFKYVDLRFGEEAITRM